jgi:hypothetical protein
VICRALAGGSASGSPVGLKPDATDPANTFPVVDPPDWTSSTPRCAIAFRGQWRSCGPGFDEPNLAMGAQATLRVP